MGVGVVRGNEMYVATVGPAEAYLIRQARLSTLPDPHRERGLPSSGLEPEVWRGEVTVGDSLVLISPNIVARLGADELKDAMVTLHPQSAMEHLHQRFRAAEGAGSDGAIAFEATEVAPTTRGRVLVPVRPPEPLAGAPDRSPIPLADNVQAAGAAMSAAADSARVVAGNAMERIIARLHEVLPRRKPAYRRVTPLASRRETQRRAAIAVIALLVVVGSLAMSVWAFGGQRQQQAISSVNAGQDALDKAKANLALVSGPGIDLIEDDRDQAIQLLTEAYDQLDDGRGRAHQRSASSTLSARTSRPCSTARTASSWWHRPRCSPSRRRRAPPRSTCARSCVATTAPRTSSTAATQCGLSGRPQAQAGHEHRAQRAIRREPEDGRSAVPRRSVAATS